MAIKKTACPVSLSRCFLSRLEWLILQAFGLSDDLRQLLGARFFACNFTLAPALHARFTQAAQPTLSGVGIRLMGDQVKPNRR